MDLEVTLHLGSRRRRVPLVAIAATLHLPREPLRQSLTGLLFASPPTSAGSDDEGETTEGESERDVSLPETLPEEEKERALGAFGGEGVRGEGRPDERHVTATFLADVLGDEGHLPALEHLVVQCTPEVIKAALDETLALPRERIRVSRGAYFTAAARRRQGRNDASIHS
ncbi:MAG: hypothetical protein EPO40_01655 [Myxococcaceae bacterium]|nr:MAG: hypothetical protein EPO40_01655 [Myxococcaceae bacterium]